MSIRIHDGLIATGGDVFTVGAMIRKILEPVFLEKFKEILKIVEELPEGSTWNDAPKGLFKGDEPIPKDCLDVFMYRKIEELDKSARWNFSDADIMYHVSLIPNMAGGNPLVLVFGNEARAYRELLIESGVVREYEYQDSSGEPDDMTQEEWDERKFAWSMLEDNAPSEVDLSIHSPSSTQCSLYLIKGW